MFATTLKKTSKNIFSHFKMAFNVFGVKLHKQNQWLNQKLIDLLVANNVG